MFALCSKYYTSLDFRFWILDFGFWILDFRFYVFEYLHCAVNIIPLARLYKIYRTYSQRGFTRYL